MTSVSQGKRVEDKVCQLSTADSLVRFRFFVVEAVLCTVGYDKIRTLHFRKMNLVVMYV